MKIYNVLFFFIAIVLFSCQAQEKRTSSINGLSFVASDRKITTKDIQPVLNINANWVAIMPFGFMPSEKKPSLSFNTKWQWWGETAHGVRTTSDYFKDKKIKRMLKPQLWIKGGFFTGHMKMTTEKDWLALEKNYENFILFYAELAQTSHFELFCIGTELNYFVSERPKFWIELIHKIKKIYKRKITYAANWDSYQNPQFWSQLDYIGIDAYFPLTDVKTPSIDELLVAWNPIKKELENFSEKNQKSIIFTEYGYRSIDHCAKEPWISDTKENFNVLAQKNALSAIYQTFWKEPWFHGGFLWKWFDNHSKAGGNTNTGFTVQNKSSEKTIKEFFSSQP